jgi:hypothetical protein
MALPYEGVLISRDGGPPILLLTYWPELFRKRYGQWPCILMEMFRVERYIDLDSIHQQRTQRLGGVLEVYHEKHLEGDLSERCSDMEPVDKPVIQEITFLFAPSTLN